MFDRADTAWKGLYAEVRRSLSLYFDEVAIDATRPFYFARSAGLELIAAYTRIKELTTRDVLKTKSGLIMLLFDFIVREIFTNELETMVENQHDTSVLWMSKQSKSRGQS